MKRQRRGAQTAWSGKLILFVLIASHALSGTASAKKSAEIPVAARCWYVVPDTVVPVNLYEVTIVSSAAVDPSFRRVTFLKTTKPMKVVTELVVEAMRLDELHEVIARRRSECAARPLQ